MSIEIIKKLGNEIHVWLAELDQPQNVVDRFLGYLNWNEKKRISKFKTETLKKKQIVSKGLLKLLIAKYLNTEPQTVEFESNEYGKPFISPAINPINLKFNISHSNRLGLYAFTTDHALGVDVEKIQELENIYDLVDLCMSDFEKRWFLKLSPGIKTDVFYKFWTVKEAFIKAVGTGFSFPLANVELKIKSKNKCELYKISDSVNSARQWRLFTFSPKLNYVASLITKASKKEIKHYNWKPSCAYKKKQYIAGDVDVFRT